MKLWITYALISSFAPSISFAKQEILGAFGLKFGQVIDVSDPMLEIKRGEIIYKPVQPNRNFTEYKIKVTPNDKLLYEISGYKFYHSKFSFEEASENLLHVLEKKYGKFTKSRYTTNGVPSYSYSKHSKRISLIGMKHPGHELTLYMLSVTYTDEDLGKKAEEQFEEIRRKQKEEDLKFIDINGL